MGDLSFVRDLPQMYHHCAEEDPDINITDFVFEHLLNIHDDDDAQEHDKPHQTVYHHIPNQTLITFYTKQKVSVFVDKIFNSKEKHPIIETTFSQQEFLSKVFRPPASLVC